MTDFKLGVKATTVYVDCCSFFVTQPKCASVSAALKSYSASNNNELPDKVIVYRDGVGDGQLDMVHQHEVRQIRDCFQAVGSDYR
jgi:Piwi domain